MSLESKVPAIRFKGFSGVWVENRVGQLCDCIVPGRNKPKTFNGDIPWVTTPDIVTNNVGKSKIGLAIYREEAKRVGAKVVPIDSIIMSCVGELGIVAKVNNELIINQQLHAFIPKENLSNWFLLYELSTRKKYMESVATKTAVPYMNKDNCNSIPIIVPSFTEQTKIGNYFQQLDTLITQHQQKHDKLLNLKKALLEKMFPKQGAEVPEIRFKGFSGEWEERALGEVADRYDNLRIPITAINRVSGTTPYYGANGIQDYVDGFTHDGEFVLVAEDGANDLKDYPVQYVNGKIWVNNHAHVLQSKSRVVDNYFLKLTISQTDIEPFLVGGGRAKLNAETMMKIAVDIPLKVVEQTKIGNLFQHLDTLINQHQSQLKKLKQIKQACLAKMFV